MMLVSLWGRYKDQCLASDDEFYSTVSFMQSTMMVENNDVTVLIVAIIGQSTEVSLSTGPLRRKINWPVTCRPSLCYLDMPYLK